MAETIRLGEISADVRRKNIKNVHLSVYPPAGKVRISAPSHMSLATIRVFAINKLGWIKNQQRQLQEQEREPPREYLEKESHFVWGKRYLLRVIEERQSPGVEPGPEKLTLRVRPGWDAVRSQSLLEEWYRGQVRAHAVPLIAKWEKVMGVTVRRLFVQRMKTRWGSCTPGRGYIRLNTELAKKPRDCLEYLVVHEMVHLLEPTHNERFLALMDQYLPQWPALREKLNRLPVKHEDWSY